MVISKRKVVTRTGAALTAAALVVPLMSAIAASPASATRAPSITSFPRSETLYTSGTAYSPPSNWNPLDTGSRYTGTMGLLYETLFLYDPIHNKYLPWLATSGSWTGPTTYTLQVRNNVKWSNGSALTGADVAYSINLAKTNPAVPYSNLGQYLWAQARWPMATPSPSTSPARPLTRPGKTTSGTSPSYPNRFGRNSRLRSRSPGPIRPCELGADDARPRWL